MPRSPVTPEERSQAVADATARHLADAVAEFASRALDSRLEPFSESAKNAVSAANRAAGKADDVAEQIATSLQVWSAGPPALKIFLDRAERRLDEADQERARLIDGVTKSSVKALGDVLGPLQQAAAQTAARSDSAASRIEKAETEFVAALALLRKGPPALGEYLSRAEERLAMLEAAHSQLVTAALRTTEAQLSTSLAPLIGSAERAANCAIDAGATVDSAAGAFVTALEDLRAGPPSLASFLEEARATIAEIQRSSLALAPQLETMDGRLTQLEKVTRRSAARLSIWLVVSGVLLIGEVGWIVLQVAARQ